MDDNNINLKLVKVGTVRKHMEAHFRDEISYSEAVNRINKQANKNLHYLIKNKTIMKEITLEHEVRIQLDYYTIGYRFSFKTAIEIIQGKYKLAITELEKIMEVDPSESVLTTLMKYKEMYIIASNMYNPKIHK